MSKNSRCYNCNELLKYVDGKCADCGVAVTSNGRPVPLCPVCEKPIKRRDKGGICPECGVVLKLVRKKVKQFNIITYEPLNVHTPIKQEAPKKELVLKTPAIEIERTGEKTWHVLYKALPERGVCPNCKKVLFKRPRFLHGSQDLKCERCKHFVTTEFRVLERFGVRKGFDTVGIPRAQTT